MPKLLITGGAGFIGSAFVKTAVHKGFSVSVSDKLTYAGDRARLASVKNQITFHKTDICDSAGMDTVLKKERPDAMINFAAETHVDRSILNSSPFIQTNIQGTACLIDLALKHRIKKFIHISTDEVYGEIKKGCAKETAPLNPGNPYASSKAAADFLIRSAVRAYNLPAVIVRPCNTYGPWQYPEKFIPVAIFHAIKNKRVPVYGKGVNIRGWMFVDDCAQAILTILKKGKSGEMYNIGPGEYRTNLQVVRSVLSILGKRPSLYKFMKDRPGHDLKYASDCSKLKRLGWKPDHIFETGLEKTILWMEEHCHWIEKKTASLQEYWKTIYKRK